MSLRKVNQSIVLQEINPLKAHVLRGFTDS